MSHSIDAEIVLLADGLVFPEGPAFSPDGAVWGVEMNAGRLFRLDDRALSSVRVGGKPNGLAVHDGSVFFCDAGRDAVMRLASSWSEPVAIEPSIVSGPDRALTAPNDLIFDARGVMIFTCPGSPRSGPSGTVWALSPSGRTTRIADGMHFPNGLALTPDGRELIVAETLGQRLWRGGWESQSMTWSDPRPWVDVGGAPLGPDGMAYGPDGLLYVALYGSSLIQVVGEDGRIVSSYAVPGAKPTNVAFDPSGRLGMVITEASHGRLFSYPGVGEP